MIFHYNGGEGGSGKKQFSITREILESDIGVFLPTKSGNLVSKAFWNPFDPSLFGFSKTLIWRLDKKGSFVLFFVAGVG